MSESQTSIYSQILTGVPNDRMKSMLKLIYDFIINEISLQEACYRCVDLVGTSEQIMKLNQIMQVSEEPPPPTQIVPEFYLDKRSKTWSQYEDQRLLAAIHRGGLLDWNKISEFVGNGRNRGQCAQRWCRSLNPLINKTPWTKEEDELLISKIRKYGHRGWTKISTEMDGRTDVQCRYRYQILSRRPLPRSLKTNSETTAKKEITPKQITLRNEEENDNDINDFWTGMQIFDLLNNVKNDPFSLFKQIPE